MAKVERESLTRGTRLPRQAVFGVFDDVAAVVGTVAVERENLAEPYAPVRVDFRFPVLANRFFRGNFVGGVGPIDFAFPISFPPLQEFFNRNLLPIESTPELILDEFQLSFDQRGEPCVLNSEISGFPGRMNFDTLSLQDITVALMEKPQAYRDGLAPATAPYVPETEIFSLSIPSLTFSDRNLRRNPFIIDGLNKTLHPYRTYMFMLNAALNDATHTVDIVSLNISFRLRHQLLARDLRTVGVRNIQNIPAHNGSKVSDPIVITTPAAGALIVADAGAGIHANAKLIDQRLSEGLRGGYWRSSHVPVTEHIAHDAGYGVLVVPMWGGLGIERGITAGTANLFPDAGAAPYTDWVMSRRIVPLNWPITIHHVVAMVSYAWPNDGAGDVGRFPTSATFNNIVGVGLGTGDKADRVSFDTIATVTWNPVTAANFTIDRVKHKRGGALTSEVFDFVLLGVPLVGFGAGADAGAGYFDQGQPIFAGRATSGTQARSNLAGGAPNTNGAEQFLEFRWHIRDTGGLSDNAAGPPAGAAGSPLETYVGMTGHFIYVYYKSHLAGGARDMPL